MQEKTILIYVLIFQKSEAMNSIRNAKGIVVTCNRVGK